MKLLGFVTCAFIIWSKCVDCRINSNIFDRFATCKYRLRNLTMHLSNQQLIISKFGRQIRLSPCAPTKSTPNCDPHALVCVSSGKEPSINAGTQFISIEHTDEDNPGDVQFMLKSLYGSTCKADPSKNYTTYVSFGSKIQPKLTDFNDCEYHVEILDPNLELPCMKRVDGHLLDFRGLAGEMKIPSGNDTFFVNLCGVARTCRDNTASACLLNKHNSAVSVIGSTSTQRISLSADNGVQITYRFGMGRQRLMTRINLKCNWNVVKANWRYVMPQTQGRNYRFIIESSLGCVKFPMRCQVQDFRGNQYDLGDLYRPDGSWEVAGGVGADTIRINMCGPLKSVSGVCTANYSQVCRTDPAGRNYNYGSILTHVEVHDYVIRATLSEGSVCARNRTLTLSTDVVFKCSAGERGPILLGFKNCSADLLWETPKACPHNVVSGDKCAVNDVLGHRDVSGVHTDADRNHRITGNSFIRYNLCGNLIKKCGDSTNASVCLHVRNKQYVLGFTSTDLISNEGLISLDVRGEECSGTKFPRKANVTFVCSYAAPISGIVSVTVVHDQCIYNMIIATPLACVSPGDKLFDCTIINESSVYNLTSLSRPDRNYVVRVPGLDVEYAINVCRPTLTSGDALCMMHTGVCLKNNSEPNLRNKYYSVGGGQKLIVQNDELQLHYRLGKLCAESVKDSSTVIHFRCSSGEEKLSFLRETNCVHEFAWSTAHACPKKLQMPRSLLREYVLRDGHGNSINLTNVQKRRVELTVDGNLTYSFDLFEDRYTRTIPGEAAQEGTARRRLVKDGSSLYIEFVLNGNACAEAEKALNSVHVFLTCVPKLAVGGAITLKSFENCVAVVELVEVCEERMYPTPVVSSESLSEQLKKETYVTATSSKTENNCTILYDQLSINMNTIRPISVVSPSKRNYTVGLGGAFSECAGYVCKEGRVIATLGECPRAEINGADLLVNFSACDGFSVKIWFKCNGSAQDVPAVLEEDERHFTLTYPLREVCTLSATGSGLNSTEIIWIIVGVLILVVAICCAARFKKLGWCTRYRRISSGKSSVEIYCKNLSE